MGRRSKPEFEVKKSAVPNGDLSWFIIGRPNGKRVRAWFPSKEKAQAEAKERNIKMRKLGEDAVGVDNALIVMATEGATLLRPYGKTLRDAVTFYVNHLAKDSASVSVVEMCRIVRAEFEFRAPRCRGTFRIAVYCGWHVCRFACCGAKRVKLERHFSRRSGTVHRSLCENL